MREIISTILAGIVMFSAAGRDVKSTLEARQNSWFIKVAGVVHTGLGNAPKTLIINECDAGPESTRCVAELDTAGRFEVCIPFYYGHTFVVNYRSLYVNAYAEPGDSVFVSIDATASPVGFHLAGDNARLNEEYSHAFLDLAPTYDVQLPPDTVALSEYMPRFKEEVAKGAKRVDRYVVEKSLMPETARLLHLDNIFILANQAIDFTGRGPEEEMAFFTDPLFDIFDERNAKVMMFHYHLCALLRRNPEFVNDVHKSLIRDLMYAARKEGEKPSRDDFVNTAYFDRLFTSKERTVDFSGLKPGNIAVMENDTITSISDVNPIEWLRTRFPSRPVYVDVSAVWCGPCRASLAGTEDVRRYFRDSDVVFAVIWLKSGMESWKKLVPDIHNAIHIFVSDDDMANRIMGTINMQGFPSYFLIDRRGEISIKDIPRLQDPALIDFLRER